MDWRLILAFITLYSRLYWHCYSPGLFSKTCIPVALERLQVLHSKHCKTRSPSSSKPLTLQKIISVSPPKYWTYTGMSVLALHTYLLLQCWVRQWNHSPYLVANIALKDEKVAASSFKALSSFRSLVMVSVTIAFSFSYLFFKLANATSAVWKHR